MTLPPYYDIIGILLNFAQKNGIKVLNPDINESESKFTVNKQGEIRFGLGGIKGFGENIVKAILADREENGAFEDIFDFVERMSGVVNRKGFEALLHSGAFDSFGICRKQFMLPCKSGEPFIDTLLKYGDSYKKDTLDSAISLFGDAEEMKPERPEIPEMVGDEDIMEKLKYEKELVGMYLSSHPLDTFSFELENFTTCQISDLPTLISDCNTKQEKMKVSVAGFITSASESMTKTGRPMSRMIVEDYSGSYEFAFFGKDHEAYMPYQKVNTAIYIEGMIEERFRLKPEDLAKGKKPEFSFKIKNMMLLGNVADTFVKGFAINITTPMLSPEFREKLVGMLKRNKGNVPLTMFLYDPVKKWNIEFLSHKFRIQVSLPLLEELKEMGITYNVIKK